MTKVILKAELYDYVCTCMHASVQKPEVNLRCLTCVLRQGLDLPD